MTKLDPVRLLQRITAAIEAECRRAEVPMIDFTEDDLVRWIVNRMRGRLRRRRRDREPGHRQWVSQYMRRQYYARRQAKRCVRCQAPAKDRTLCPPCAADARRRSLAYYYRRQQQQRSA